ncbi:MAG: hypothetical protein LBU48_02275, partial [Coriobacteriales bacterium]|nr:hypothetical protein [Coriobacteriales bacterium]
MSIESIKRRRLLYLCVATPSLLVLGLLYAWSIFAVPLGAQFNWDRSALSQVYSVSMIAFCLGSLTGSQIARVFSVKSTIVCAAVLLAIGFATTATLASWGIGVLYLFYGVLAGFGCGIGYNTIVS